MLRSHLVLLEDLSEGDDLRIDEALQELDFVTDAEQLSLALGQLALPSDGYLAGVIVGASGDESPSLAGEIFCGRVMLAVVLIARKGWGGGRTQAAGDLVGL